MGTKLSEIWESCKSQPTNRPGRLGYKDRIASTNQREHGHHGVCAVMVFVPVWYLCRYGVCYGHHGVCSGMVVRNIQYEEEHGKCRKTPILSRARRSVGDMTWASKMREKCACEMREKMSEMSKMMSRFHTSHHITFRRTPTTHHHHHTTTTTTTPSTTTSQPTPSTSQLPILAMSRLPYKAKVGDPDVAVAIDQHVLGLQIPEHDVQVVEVPVDERPPRQRARSGG